MKRALFGVLITSALLLGLTRRANAEAPPPQNAVVREANEAADAWLHEHCSYRGMYVATEPLSNAPGTIATLVESTASSWSHGVGRRIAKVFRCGERPAFWTAPFEPAPPAAVTCADARDSAICVPPMRAKRSEPSDRWLPPSQPVNAAAKTDVKNAALFVTSAPPGGSPTVHTAATRAGDALAPPIPTNRRRAEPSRRTGRRYRRDTPEA